MKSLGGNGIFLSRSLVEDRAVRVSDPNLKAARGKKPCRRKTLMAQLDRKSVV